MERAATPRYAPLTRAWTHDFTPYCKLATASRDVLAVYQAEIRALDVRTGTLRWTWRAPSVIADHAVARDAVLAVAEGTIHALSLETGQVTQSFAVPDVRPYARVQPIVCGEHLVWVTAPSEDAPRLWSAPLDALASATSRPLAAGLSVGDLFAAGDRLVASRYAGDDVRVSLVDVATGEVGWDVCGRFDEGRSPRVLDVFDDVVVVRQGTEIVGVALATGRELWRSDGRFVLAKAGPRRLVRVSRPKRGGATKVGMLDVATGAEVEAATYELVGDGKLEPGRATALAHDGVVWLRNPEESFVGIAEVGGAAVELSTDAFASPDFTGLVATDGHVVMATIRGLAAFPYAPALAR